MFDDAPNWPRTARGLLFWAASLGGLDHQMIYIKLTRLRSCHLHGHVETMQTYRDLIELARICREQARATKDPDVAAELRRMAREYQERVSKLNARQVPALDHS